MKIFLILLLVTTWQLYVVAQPLPADGKVYTDSLEKALHTHVSDSTKARINFLLSDYWSDTDTLKSIAYLNKAKVLAGNNQFLNGLFYFYNGQLIYSSNLTLSESAYIKADSILKKINSKDAYLFRSRAWRSYGALQQLKDNNKEFLNVLLTKSIPLAKQSGDTIYVGKIYTDVGLIFMNEWEYKTAANYFDNAIIVLSRKPRSTELLYAYILASKNDFYRDSLSRGKLSLDKAKSILTSYQNSDYYTEYYGSEVLYYEQTKQYIKALQSLDSGIAVSIRYNNIFEKEAFMFLKYKIYDELKDYKKAKDIVIEIIHTTRRNSSQNRTTLYKEAANIYFKLNKNDSAYLWLLKYADIKDSVYEQDVVKDINELEKKFNTAEKEKKILFLQSEKDKAALLSVKHKSENQLLIASCIFLIALTLFSILYYIKTSKQTKLNYQQKLKEIEQQNQLNFTQAMLEGEERERQRMARDLHDGLGGMLAGIKINLSEQKMKHTQNLDNVIIQLDESVSELRRIARNMMPESLLKVGLQAALQDLCEAFMSDKTQIEFQAYGIQKNMNAITQVNIYRIVQEILSNAIRHAQANKIIVQCSQNENVFLITIEDNGKGFDVNTIASAKGIGFSNIKNRVDYLKGSIYIDSKLNEGTTINIELNVHE